jgi:hypothetical protein
MKMRNLLAYLGIIMLAGAFFWSQYVSWTNLDATIRAVWADHWRQLGGCVVLGICGMWLLARQAFKP